MVRIPCESMRFDCTYAEIEAIRAQQLHDAVLFLGWTFGIGLLACVAIIVSVKTLELFTKDSNDDDD